MTDSQFEQLLELVATWSNEEKMAASEVLVEQVRSDVPEAQRGPYSLILIALAGSTGNTGATGGQGAN